MPPPALFLPAPPLSIRGIDPTFRRSSRPRRCTPVANRQPPPVKSGFYKNPSKAIEKGGGFYIPGLRGPRLRLAVSGLTATLLTLNHLSGGAGVAQRSLHMSELLAGTAVATVLGTAVLDIAAEQREVRGMEGAEVYVDRVRDEDAGEAQVSSQVGEVVAWVESVAADLCDVSMVAVCREGKVIYGKGVSDGVYEAGEVVRRVADGGRVFYVEDAGTLPSEATIPFLKENAAEAWAVLFIPVGRQVVVFGRVGGGLAVGDRAWLVQMAARVAGGCA